MAKSFPLTNPIKPVPVTLPVAAPTPDPQQVMENTPTGETINLVSPDGRVVNGPVERSQALIDLGYRPETIDEAKERQLKAKYGDAPISAFGLGALRGLTFGASDLLTKEAQDAGVFPEGTIEAVNAIKRLNPKSSFAGELSSLAIPGLGEAAFGAKAGKALGAGFEATSAVGKAIGDATKKIVGEKLGQFAAPAAKLAAESVIFNAANNISEQSLENRDLAVESVFAHYGPAALFGAGLGAAIPITGKLATMSYDGIKAKLGQFGEKYAKNIEDSLAEKIGSDTAAKVMQDPFGEAGAAFREDLLKQSPEKVKEQVAQSLQEDLNGLIKNNNDLKGLWTPIKNDVMKFYAEKPEWNVAVSPELLKLREGIINDLVELNKNIIQDSPLFARKVLGITTDFAEKEPSKLYEFFDDLNTVKQKLGGLADFEKNKLSTTVGQQIASSAIRKIYNGIKPVLEEQAKFGEFATAQSEFNAAFSEMERASKFFNQEFGRKAPKGVGIVDRVDAAKVNKFVKNLNTPLSENQAYALDRYFEASQGMQNAIERYSSELKAGNYAGRISQEGIESILKNSTSAQIDKLVQDSKGSLGFMNSLVQPPKTLGTLADAARSQPGVYANIANYTLKRGLVGVLGGSIGGGTGAALSIAAAEALERYGMMKQNPLYAVSQLSWLEQNVLKTKKMIERSIPELLGKIDGAIPTAIKLAPVKIGSQFLTNKQEKDKSWYGTVSNKLTKIVTNPEAYVAKNNLGALEVQAPSTAQDIKALEIRVYNYLYQKMPKPKEMGMNALKTNYTPSETELRKFQRVVNVAASPLSIIPRIRQGVVKPEEIATVKELYPSIYEQIVKAVFDKMAVEKERLPVVAKRRLSVLTGVPLDRTMQPSFIAKMQNMQPQQNQPQEERSGSSRKVNNMKSISNAMSETERVSNRGK